MVMVDRLIRIAELSCPPDTYLKDRLLEMQLEKIAEIAKLAGELALYETAITMVGDRKGA